MKVSVILPPASQRAFAAAVGVSLLVAHKLYGQAIVPPQATAGATAEVERVIVTGSNIPSAEEVGPNPVDTYRPADVGSSRVDLQACKLEYSIVSPK